MTCVALYKSFQYLSTTYIVDAGELPFFLLQHAWGWDNVMDCVIR